MSAENDSSLKNGDQRDQREARFIVAAMVLLAILAFIGMAIFVPALHDFAAQEFSPGVGLKTSALIAFFVTIAVFVTFAIVAGDGLIGELQFMLAGFFGFFVICWLMIAWIF